MSAGEEDSANDLCGLKIKLIFRKNIMEIIFADDSFDKEILNGVVPVLVDFWAPWCGPCQTMGPIISELAEEMNGKVKIGKLNVEENPETAQKFSVMSIPTLIIFKNGKEIKRLVGLQAKETLKEELGKI
jgi:thioredoxin 1